MGTITGGNVIAGSKARGDGWVPIPLSCWREVASNDIAALGTAGATGSGGVLATDTAPAYEYINGATDKGHRVLWAASNVDAIACSVPLPPDLDDAQAVTVHFYGEMGGATDTPTLTVAAFFGIGDSDAGGATGAMANAVGEVSVSLAAADVLAHPNSLALEVTPGAHTTDTLIVYATWLEYSRKNA
jgi:hypothetical protein